MSSENTTNSAGAQNVPALRIHIVRSGDSLRSISRNYLGDSRRYKEIKDMNDLTTDVLSVGMELIIPDR